MKEFNTTAVCISSKHYMVDLSERVESIRGLVDQGKYFTINRARQYGKTTTLNAIKDAMSEEYYVVFMDFQDYSDVTFESENTFCEDFANNFCSILLELIAGNAEHGDSDELGRAVRSMLALSENNDGRLRFYTLFKSMRTIWDLADKPIVLLIDEVDRAANNQVFLDFLSQLRSQYLKRERDSKYRTFQSVILAGVTDVKHLKSRIRAEDQHSVNSPWNIAADFDIDMSLSEEGIKGMLDEYETDHRTGMDTAETARQIREYTNGYPYLVSRICQMIDTRMVPESFKNLAEAWTEYGVDEAVRRMLSETNNPLFQSLTGKLTNLPELKRKLRLILLRGETLAWLPYDEEQQQLYMYGLIRNAHNTVAVANRIFEMLLYTHFIGENDDTNDLKQEASEVKSIFVDEDGWLDVPKIMEHFINEHHRIYQKRNEEQTEKFLEDEGRERFLTYVSAIINGTGTYSIEEQTRDQKRMDVVLHYLGKRYIIELKLWRGERYHAKGEQQIIDYLNRFGLSTGYMLSFNFNKKKTTGVSRVQIGDKVLFEGTV